MAKFPINLVLSAAIAGLLGMIGWQFYLAWPEPRFPDSEQLIKQLDDKLKVGRSRQPESRGTDYSNSTLLNKFRDANFIGAEPKVAVEPEEPAAAPTQIEADRTPVKDILVVRMIVYAGKDGQDSRIIVTYKPEANVTPPPEVLEAMAMGRDASLPAARTSAPATRRAGPASTVPMPTAAGTDGYMHHLELGDRLWETYQAIRLVDVDPDARFAVFVRDDPSKPQEELPREKVYPEVLQLDQATLAALSEGGIGDGGGEDGRRAAEETETVDPALQSAWQPTQVTRKIASSEWHVGTDDTQVFRQDPNRILGEGVSLSSYRGKYTSGVKVTRIAPQYRSYGILEDDVLVALNGQPVSTKAEAVQVGKELWRKGVRTFRAEFLSQGRHVVRTYVAPNK